LALKAQLDANKIIQKQVKMNKKQEVQLSIPCNGGFLIVK
jgi:hypothetical protein